MSDKAKECLSMNCCIEQKWKKSKLYNKVLPMNLDKKGRAFLYAI